MRTDIPNWTAGRHCTRVPSNRPHPFSAAPGFARVNRNPFEREGRYRPAGHRRPGSRHGCVRRGLRRPLWRSPGPGRIRRPGLGLERVNNCPTKRSSRIASRSMRSSAPSSVSGRWRARPMDAWRRASGERSSWETSCSKRRWEPIRSCNCPAIRSKVTPEIGDLVAPSAHARRDPGVEPSTPARTPLAGLGPNACVPAHSALRGNPRRQTHRGERARRRADRPHPDRHPGRGARGHRPGGTGRRGRSPGRRTMDGCGRDHPGTPFQRRQRAGQDGPPEGERFHVVESDGRIALTGTSGWVKALHEGAWDGSWSGALNLISALALIALVGTGLLSWWRGLRRSPRLGRADQDPARLVRGRTPTARPATGSAARLVGRVRT